VRLSGFRDKLYWRPAYGGLWHCFKKLPHAQGGGYTSLCHQVERARSGGQSICRPPAYMRCAQCDGVEMKRRGWEESGSETVSRSEALELFK
jgi:hypothetical protein